MAVFFERPVFIEVKNVDYEKGLKSIPREIRSLEGVIVAPLLGQLILFHINRDYALPMAFFTVLIVSSNQVFPELLPDDCGVLKMQVEDETSSEQELRNMLWYRHSSLRVMEKKK